MRRSLSRLPITILAATGLVLAGSATAQEEGAAAAESLLAIEEILVEPSSPAADSWSRR